jgi:hypothetical protein
MQTSRVIQPEKGGGPGPQFGPHVAPSVLVQYIRYVLTRDVSGVKQTANVLGRVPETTQ